MDQTLGSKPPSAGEALKLLPEKKYKTCADTYLKINIYIYFTALFLSQILFHHIKNEFKHLHRLS